MGEDEEPLALVKERVLHRLLTIYALGTVALVALFYIQGLSAGLLRPTAWIPTSLALAIVPLRLLHHKLGYRRSGALLIAYLLLVPGYLQIYRGLAPGAVLMHITALLVAALLFGKRGVLVTFAGFFGSLALGAYAMTHARAIPWSTEFWEPRHPIVWVRYVVVLLVLGGGLANAFGELLGQLERRAERLRATLQREREERERREAAQRALERSQRLEAMAQLAGGMAHDFNNDLALMMGHAELIATGDAPAGVKRHARVIIETAQAGARSVRRLLALGRKEPLNLESVDVRALLRACQHSIQRLLPSNIELDVEAEPALRVVADGGRLQQAVLNLALNARDAMPQGGKLTLRADLRRREGDGAEGSAGPRDFVCITCRDTGIGMDDATQRRAFEPFFTTKAESKGSGLGLALVHTTVLEAGGFTELESRVGHGTEFRLHLPAEPTTAQVQPLHAALLS